MTQSKKSDNWFASSFDWISDESNKPMKCPTKKPSVKPSCSNTIYHPYKETTFKRKKSETSISKLLDACEPQKPAELAISKQKQNEISDWLECRAITGKPSMLVLSGPSGCGKTAATKLLARENQFDIIEWITPVDQAEFGSEFLTRQGDRFEDQLIRATRYRTVFGNYSKQLLLVKDIPNVYQENQKGFTALLEKYFQMGKEPVIFICTETKDSRLLQTLFAPTVREKYGIDIINVNSVTPTAMKNVLKRVSGTLNSVACDMLHILQEHIDEIHCNSIGDVRNAILNLIFISLKVPKEYSQKQCGIRRETLNLLHGIGRVINPKKESGKLVHDPEELAGFFQSQPAVFVNFLHENYLNTIGTLEDAVEAIEILSVTDTMSGKWRDPHLSEVALSYCICGLMLANKKPKSAWNPVRKPRDDHSNIRRCLRTAELEWYKSIIKPSTKEPEEVLNDDVEIVIEES